MDDLQKLLFEAQQKEQHEKRIEVLIKILSAVYDKAIAYTNLVIIAGYAAFFAVWGTMKAQLSEREMLASAFCITLSLIFFVFWETLKMVITSRNSRGLLRVLQAPPDQFDTRLAEQQKGEQKLSVSLLRIWIIILFLTVIPGLVAGGILLFSFGRQLFWP